MTLVQRVALCIAMSVILAACNKNDEAISSESTVVITGVSNWDNAQWDNSSWK